MQRYTAAALGLVFVAAVVGLILQSRSHRVPEPSVTKPAATASQSAAPKVSAAPTSSAAVTDAVEDAALASTEGFLTFPDGGKVPELPDAAPKVVSFGVVLFAYHGAQGAPTDARSRELARAKAEGVLELAHKDFSAAVSKGDRGSTANAGRIPRGVLEPPIEYLLFTLDKAAIYPTPIDTPRGYWILRRND